MTPLLVGAAIAAVALVFVLLPLLTGEGLGSWEVTSRARPLADTQRDSAVQALREIEFDRATGTLSDGDYATLKSDYTAQALVAMRAADAVAAGGAVSEDRIEALVQSARARGADLLIADTAGRLQAQTHLMEELRKVRRVLGKVDPNAPQEVLLVIDATQGQNALAQAQQFHAAVGVTGLVLTKLDGTARGGIVLAIARQLTLPIRFVGLGEQARDLAEFDAAAFARALVDGPAV